jgi:hypothetical protein
MPAPVIVVIDFVFALIAYSLVARWYIFPALVGKPLRSTLPPLILVHLIRPVSLWLLAPGVIVQASLPRTFATGTAYGDLVTAVLALVAALMVRAEKKGALVAVWVFNVVGTLDALRNCAVGIFLQAPNHMGAAVLIPAFGVPAIFVSHALIFERLMSARRYTA